MSFIICVESHRHFCLFPPPLPPPPFFFLLDLIFTPSHGLPPPSFLSSLLDKYYVYVDFVVTGFQIVSYNPFVLHSFALLYTLKFVSIGLSWVFSHFCRTFTPLRMLLLYPFFPYSRSHQPTLLFLISFLFSSLLVPLQIYNTLL